MLGGQAFEVDSRSLRGLPVTLVTVPLKELQLGNIGGQCRGWPILRHQVPRGARRDQSDTQRTE